MPLLLVVSLRVVGHSLPLPSCGVPLYVCLFRGEEWAFEARHDTHGIGVTNKLAADSDAAPFVRSFINAAVRAQDAPMLQSKEQEDIVGASSVDSFGCDLEGLENVSTRAANLAATPAPEPVTFHHRCHAIHIPELQACQRFTRWVNCAGRLFQCHLWQMPRISTSQVPIQPRS